MGRVTRRQFLGQAVAASGSMAMAQQNTNTGEIPKRPLGKDRLAGFDYWNGRVSPRLGGRSSNREANGG